MITFTVTNKHRPKATVVMPVSLYGKQYKKSIGIGVPVKYWNDSKKRARTTADFKEGNEINDEIDRWAEIGKRAVKYFIDARISPTSKEFAAKIAELTAAHEEVSDAEKRYFTDYLEKVYIPRYSIAREKLTVVKYTQALHKLQDFKRETRRHQKISEIDIDFYNRFQHWFYEQGYSRNYFGNIIKIVKQVYRESRVCDRLHNEHGTDHRDFIAPKDSVDNVYLDLKELEKIYTLDIPSAVQKDAVCNKAQEGENIPRKIAALNRARGLFLIGCYTGLRVSMF